jgi:tetratricopeptide (TPR) repeat protein
MTRSYRFSYLVSLLFACSIASADDSKPGPNQDSWVGKEVLCKRAGVEMGEIGASGQMVNLRKVFSPVFEVEKEEGSRILIRDRGKHGWADKAGFVPLDGALAYFTERLRVNPKDADAWMRRGIAQCGMRNLDAAIADSDEAIRHDGSLSTAYYCRGMAYSGKLMLDDAFKDFNDALRLDPEHIPALCGRGLVHMMWWGNCDKAIKDFDEAIRLSPACAMAFANRGSAWGNKREFEKALQDLDEAIRLDPKLLIAFQNRGCLWVNQGESDKALADFDKAIRLEPNCPQTYCFRGGAWFNKKDFEKALKDFNEAIRLEPRFVNAFVLRGQTWCAKHDYGKAAKDFDDALQINPHDVGALRAKAWFLATCEDERYRDGRIAVYMAMTVQTTAETLTQSTQPGDLEILAAAYAEAGEFDKAAETQKKALSNPEYDKQSVKRGRELLKLYKAKKPYREK